MTKSKATAVATRSPRRKAASRKSVESSVAASGGSGIYSVHPGVAMMQRWIAELKAKTGRSLPQWLKHIANSGPDNEKECRVWLRSTYGLGANSAWWLAEKSFGNSLGLADDTPAEYLRACPAYVAGMYSGPKVTLRPIHDELVRLARALGDDVRVCPCKTIVPLYRRHVFAEIKPATSKRIDLGFALRDEPFTGRLLDTGGRAKKNRITHRVALAALEDIDLQVKRWLKEAYEQDVE